MQIVASNVNDAFKDALWQMRVSGVREESRNGPVVSITEPVTITYLSPQERILWNDKRDANPFFHLMESLWMLAGRDDSEYVKAFNKRMAEYAEEDGRIHGAYGMRWRYAYGIDQLALIINELQNNPQSRRAVLAMWYATADLNKTYKDLPCNTHAYFRIVNGALDMTVCNRSNDLLWGAFGANAVHFSILQEFLAGALRVHVGKYHQITNNLHLYLNVEMARDFLENPPHDSNDWYYTGVPIRSLLWGHTWKQFLADLPSFLSRNYAEINHDSFLYQIAAPMQEYYLLRKAGIEDAEWIHQMPECDWRLACLRWIERRKKPSDQLTLWQGMPVPPTPSRSV